MESLVFVCAERCYDATVMTIAQVTEYQVQLFHDAATAQWKAVVLAFPQIVAEGISREDVLAEITQKLSATVEDSEIVTIPILSRESSVPTTSDEKKLKEQGYRHYGIFADDPGALEVFEDIERQRDQHTING
jgi:predicted RNase H-like HicB family nuclease